MVGRGHCGAGQVDIVGDIGRASCSHHIGTKEVAKDNDHAQHPSLDWDREEHAQFGPRKVKAEQQ